MGLLCVFSNMVSSVFPASLSLPSPMVKHMMLAPSSIQINIYFLLMVNCACSHFSRSSSSILKSNPALVSLRYTVSVTPVPVQSSPPFPIPNHSIPCLHTPSVSPEPTINAIRSSTSRFPWPDSGEGKLTSIGHPA